MQREARVFSPCSTLTTSKPFFLCSYHDFGCHAVFTASHSPERLGPHNWAACFVCAPPGASQETAVITNKCVLLKVWKIALQGPCYMTLLMIAFGLLWGHLLQIRPTQSVFISTCLSLSSTPLVSRFLMGSARGEKEGRW